MVKIAVAALIAFLAGAIVITTLSTNDDQSKLTDAEPKILASSLSANAPFEERLQALEQRLEAETLARTALEKMIESERNQRLELATRVSELNGLDDVLANTLENNPVLRNLSRFSRWEFGDGEDEITTLVEAGFAQSEAQRIVELQSDLQQQLINARFRGSNVSPRELMLDTQKTLRSELGDDQYELYLQTTGRPTSVPVSGVAEGSAGSIAGIQAGDEVFNYDGNRVFNVLDLQEATRAGTPGQSVVIEVMRDGSPVTMVLPRGQIGISTDGFGFRRRFEGR